MYTIPFHETTYTPKSIPGNETADKPVTFTLSQVGGPDLMRLRGLVYATAGFAHLNGWNKDVQANVLDAFRESPTFFVRGIDAIANLSVPAALARKVGLSTEGKDGDLLETVPIKNGVQFAAISGHVIPLAFEIAMQIATLSSDAEIDTRFFGLASGSKGSRTTPSGSARPVRQPRKSAATAAGATPKAN